MCTHAHTHMHTYTHAHTHSHMHILTHIQDVEGAPGDGGDPERRVTVIETSTGTKLTGDEAPKKCELEKWLQEHPG